MSIPVLQQGAVSAVTSCLMMLALGRSMPSLLRRLGAGKIIRAEEPTAHQEKTGTPSMAGLVFSLVTLLITALFIAPAYPIVWLLLALLVATASLGLIDDLSSSTRFNSGGMRARVKLWWLVLISGVTVAIGQSVFHTHLVHLPFLGDITIGPLYWPLGVLVIVGTSNAVNLTDGLDGLAGGTGAIAALAIAVLSIEKHQAGIALLLFVLAGALIGFLWYNVHPAQFFMGDTGALGVGALLGGAALFSGEIVVLPIIGVVFVAEALSVIVQVVYFRRTGGRRIFRMSPLHLHFELGGWTETCIVERFWLVGVWAALAGVSLGLT